MLVWCVFSVGFCLCFCFIFGGSLPKLFGKILLMSGLLFSGFVLSSFGFFASSSSSFQVLVFFKRYSSGSNRTPPHALVLLFLFALFCPAALVCSAHFGRASCFLAFFSGCHSGPRVFLGFSLNLRGLSSLAPSEAPFLGTRGGKGVSWLLFLGLCFPLLFCSAASHVLLEGPANGSTYGRPGALDVPPSPE